MRYLLLHADFIVVPASTDWFTRVVTVVDATAENAIQLGIIKNVTYTSAVLNRESSATALNVPISRARS